MKQEDDFLHENKGFVGDKKEKLGVWEMKMIEVITTYLKFSKIKIINGEVQKKI